ncbi:4-hydroxy-4-methyl-2-oxoglutarate aldolase [Catenulispora sp. GP43]|uniref:RraA family protein n=1 Tax=Catenulispora sp. GP43 TaxID=3156263 RepID=UPI0035180735
MNTSTPTPASASASAEIEALAAWDTPALSNALDALRLRPFNAGYTDGSIQRLTGAEPIVGFAVTARMVARDPGNDAVPVSVLHEAISKTSGPVVVVIEDCDTLPGAGAFLGEVNGALLAALGVRGLVTNGRVRDIEELRCYPYPVYATGLCVARAHMRLIEVGCPAAVAGMHVDPGDILHGDEHGMLNIPRAALPAVLDKADLIRQDEQQVVGWSQSDEFSIPGLLEMRRIRH